MLSRGVRPDSAVSRSKMTKATIDVAFLFFALYAGGEVS